MKRPITCLIFLMTFLSSCSDAKTHEIVGHWNCETAQVKNSAFSVSISSEVDILLPDTITTFLKYHFIFSENEKLSLKIKLTGSWRYEDGTLFDQIQEVNIMNVQGNNAIPDEQLTKIVEEKYVLNKETSSIIRFVSDNKFIWKKEGEEENRICKR